MRTPRPASATAQCPASLRVYTCSATLVEPHADNSMQQDSPWVAQHLQMARMNSYYRIRCTYTAWHAAADEQRRNQSRRCFTHLSMYA